MYYDTDRFHVKEDILGKVIPICKSLDLEIHTWMWTMPCNNPAILKKHPDWYAVNGKGEPANTHPAYVDYYKFLCPKHPEVREFIQANVHSLASIGEIDGVHLDYVRLPDAILPEALQPKYNIVQTKFTLNMIIVIQKPVVTLLKNKQVLTPSKILKTLMPIKPGGNFVMILLQS